MPSAYDLVVTPSLEKLDFTVDMEITLDVRVSVNTITMHSKEIVIGKASIDGQNTSDITYDEKATTVTLTFANAITVGQKTLKMAYTGILNGDMSGFYKSSYSNADGEKMVMASTQFEALDARRAFPCWDEPDVKATFKVALIIEKHLQALSNMPETRSQLLPGNKRRVDFDVSPIMSTYLLAWAIGEFDMVQGKTVDNVAVRIFCPPGRAPQGQFALDAGIEALNFYNNFFGIEYPLPKLDMLCVTEFAAGAMENWGLVTYREVDLMIGDDASSQQRQRVAIVVAHELAHQWFGNLVTMEWWNGLWLNEGFAAFMEHFCVDSLYPEYKIWDQYTTDAFGAAQRLDSLRSSHPVIVPIKHAEEVEQVFDAISYCKGSTCVRMVMHVIGIDAFRVGLQTYFAKYKFNNATTDQLWAEWSAASGVDIAGMMDTWTKTMGYPYLKVVSEKWENESLEIELEQNWFLADGSATSDEGPLWSIPLQFATSSGVFPEKPVIMTTKRHSITVPFAGGSDASNWVKMNNSQNFFVRCAHSEEMSRRLKPALKSQALHAVDRAALVLDSYALAKAGLGAVENVVHTLVALENEDSSVVFGAISSVLGGLLLLTEQMGAATHAAFKKLGKRLVMSALAKCGWDAKDSDGHTEKLFRSTCIALLDTFASDEPAVFNEAKRRFDGHFANSALLPADYKTTVYKILLKSGGLEEYEAILKTYTDTDDNSIRKFAMGSLGATQDKDLKIRTLDWAVKSGEVKLQDFFYPIGSVVSDADGGDIAWKYYQENFQDINKMLAKANSSLMDACIMFTCSRFCTSEKADEISAFFEANPLPNSVRRISQLLENMRTTAQFLDRIKSSNFDKIIESC